jgi:cytochrome b561
MDRWFQWISRALGWISAILVAFMLLSGYGVTESRFFTALTLGYWNKALSQQWHAWWGVPIALIISLCLHILMTEVLRKRRNDQKELAK